MNPLDGGEKTQIVGLIRIKLGGYLPNWAISIISGIIPNEMKGDYENGYKIMTDKGLIK